MVIKKKGDKEEEVQSGWVGRVIPFDLVQTTLLREDYDALKAKEARLDEIAAELTEIIDSIDEGDRGEFLNDDNTAFVAKEFAAKLAEIYGDISSPELDGLQGYLELLDSKAGKRKRFTTSIPIRKSTGPMWRAILPIPRERFRRMSRHCGWRISSRRIPLRRRWCRPTN